MVLLHCLQQPQSSKVESSQKIIVQKCQWIRWKHWPYLLGQRAPSSALLLCCASSHTGLIPMWVSEAQYICWLHLLVSSVELHGDAGGLSWSASRSGFVHKSPDLPSPFSHTQKRKAQRRLDVSLGRGKRYTEAEGSSRVNENGEKIQIRRSPEKNTVHERRNMFLPTLNRLDAA